MGVQCLRQAFYSRPIGHRQTSSRPTSRPTLHPLHTRSPFQPARDCLSSRIAATGAECAAVAEVWRARG
eukprot:15439336-Alexandrium_andersonii.AAC.1